MSIPTVYIKGTKKQANETLALLMQRMSAAGQLECVEYSIYGQDQKLLASYPDGTVIKFWTKKSGGNPIVTSYGNWKPAKNKIV